MKFTSASTHELAKTPCSPAVRTMADPGQGDAADAEALCNAAMARLERERPESLRSGVVEVCFVAAVVMSMMMSEYFLSGFNVVLPSVMDDLCIPLSSRTWPAAVVSLTTAALLQPCARLCDIYGCRTIFLWGHCWLLIWSVVSGFSRDNSMLITCRAMQGVGSAAFLPAGMALLGQTYRLGCRKNTVFTIYGAFASVGFCLGLFGGALSAEYLGWRWYFWMGAVMECVICVLSFFGIPRGLIDGETDEEKVQMDWWGVCTIVPGVILTVFAFTNARQAYNGWATPYIYVPLIVGTLFLIFAVYAEGQLSKQPLLPPELFRVRYIKRLITVLFCAYGVFGLFLYYATYHIESSMKVGPVLTAVWFIPLAAGGVCLALVGGLVLRLLSGTSLMLTSCLGFALAMTLFTLIPEPGRVGMSRTTTYWAYIFPAMLGCTLGVDLAFNVSNVFITTSMPRQLQATASGMINSLLYLGIAFWLGIVELAIGNATSQAAVLGGPIGQNRLAFLTGLCLAVVALCVTCSIRLGPAIAEQKARERERRKPPLTDGTRLRNSGSDKAQYRNK